MVLKQSREFDAIKVGRCHVQSAIDRYGFNPSIPLDPDDVTLVDTGFGQDSDDDGGNSDTDESQYLPGAESPYDQFPELPEFDPNFRPEIRIGARNLPILPTMARDRMNLTALSQRYNLYFVAYEGDIHTYRPRDAVRNAIPSAPDYVLKTKPVGPNFIGHIHPKGHQVNNMVVGDMGEEEVLGLVFDNGNVVAYNVRVIANHIATLERDPRSWAGRTPRPFFHQSVEMSAWGIALHKKSRLIAVSCNLKTITVFYPALESDDGRAQDLNTDIQSSCPTSDYDVDTNDGLRRHNRRMVFKPRPGATNLPAVAFSSHPDGTADKVAGIDLTGRVWVFDVWGKDANSSVELPYNAVRSGEPDWARGWGIMFLPASSFLPVPERKTAFGAKYDREIRALRTQPSFIGWDISSTKANIPENLLAVPEDEDEATTSGDSGDEGEDVPPGIEAPTTLLPLLPAPPSSALGSSRFDQTQKRPRARVPSWPSARVSGDDNEYSLFRIGLLTMELHSLHPDGDGVAATGMLEPEINPQDHQTRILWANVDRPNKLLHIPELSLIVVGNMWGYVALVRLTEVASDGQRCFRIEWTLPRHSDTVGNKALARLWPFQGVRHHWYLHGIATSPIPENRPHQSHVPCRRFRLLLHYRNFTILSYELSRDVGTDELLVV